MCKCEARKVLTTNISKSYARVEGATSFSLHAFKDYEVLFMIVFLL